MRSMVKGNRAYEDVPCWLRVSEGDLRVDPGNLRAYAVTDEYGNRRIYKSKLAVAKACGCAESTLYRHLIEGGKICGKYTVEEVL